MKSRKLTADEIMDMESKSSAGSNREVMKALYDSLVTGFVPGEYGELTLGVDEKKPTVRKQFVAAAFRAGLGVEWYRGTANTLKFQINDQPNMKG